MGEYEVLDQDEQTCAVCGEVRELVWMTDGERLLIGIRCDCGLVKVC